MNTKPWGHFHTAPLAIKALSVLCVFGTLFFIFHTIAQFIYEKEIAAGTFYIAPWTQELYLNLWVALPVFLVLTGTAIRNPRVKKPIVVFVLLFGVCYVLNIGNVYEWVDIPHLQYPQSVALIGMLVCWIINITKKKKSALDILKFICLFGLSYAFIVPRFVRSGHELGN